jgi:hypothetical protein
VPWEDRNADAFRDVYAFVSNLKATTDDVKKYHWRYLQGRTKCRLRILTPVMDDFENAKSAMIEAIADSSPHENSNRIKGKVDIRQLSRDEAQEIRELLKYDSDKGRLIPPGDSGKEVELKNVWLYQLTRNGITIGFVDSWACSPSCCCHSGFNSWI